jgi:hypothetical protein
MAAFLPLTAKNVADSSWDTTVTAGILMSVRFRSIDGAGAEPPGGYPQCLTPQGLITLSPAAWKGATSRVATAKP